MCVAFISLVQLVRSIRWFVSFGLSQIVILAVNAVIILAVSDLTLKPFLKHFEYLLLNVVPHTLLPSHLLSLKYVRDTLDDVR